MSRALARKQLVTGGGPPRCPECGRRLAFAIDRQGRTVEHCGCGYRGYVRLRDGTPAAEPPLTSEE
jgi:hypothetical protein